MTFMNLSLNSNICWSVVSPKYCFDSVVSSLYKNFLISISLDIIIFLGSFIYLVSTSAGDGYFFTLMRIYLFISYWYYFKELSYFIVYKLYILDSKLLWRWFNSAWNSIGFFFDIFGSSIFIMLSSRLKQISCFNSELLVKVYAWG